MASGVESRLAATEYQREAVRFAGKYAGYYAELGRLWHSGKMSDTQSLIFPECHKRPNSA